MRAAHRERAAIEEESIEIPPAVERRRHDHIIACFECSDGKEIPITRRLFSKQRSSTFPSQFWSTVAKPIGQANQPKETAPYTTLEYNKTRSITANTNTNPQKDHENETE